MHISQFWRNRRVADGAQPLTSENESVPEIEQARACCESLSGPSVSATVHQANLTKSLKIS